MGTTLTGTTPQDTYDSLIKVTDNGPISGTLKALSDGLGNDSTLSLSTTAASIAGTLAVTGNATFDTNTLFVDAANNRVGVGTTSPDTALDVNGGAKVRGSISGFSGAEVLLNAGVSQQVAISTNGTSTTEMFFDHRGTTTGIWNFRDTTATRMVINAGNVGIGTSSPSVRLQANTTSTTNAIIAAVVNPSAADNITKAASISFGLADTVGFGKEVAYLRAFTDGGNVVSGGLAIDVRKADNTPSEIARFTKDGLTFNGDTAAANALDDYEEGTWTMGVSFGGASVGVTYGLNTGKYTKIGRQVTVTGYLTLTSKGSSTGSAKITGLPFTITNDYENYAAPALWFDNITFANQFQANGAINSTTISLQEITTLGVVTGITNADFANDSSIIISFTYFV